MTCVITKTRLYNVDPLKPHFYVVKPGFTRVYNIFLISAQKHRLWVLGGRTASPSTNSICFEQKYETYENFYLNKLVFVMYRLPCFFF